MRERRLQERLSRPTGKGIATLALAVFWLGEPPRREKRFPSAGSRRFTGSAATVVFATLEGVNASKE
jgi:hypothetical protein